MPTVTVSTLQDRVCTLCDLPATLSTSTNPTAAQMLDLLKTSTEQLGAIVREYAAELYLGAAQDVQTTAGQDYVSLPAGFADLVRAVWVRSQDKEIPLELANADAFFAHPQASDPNDWAGSDPDALRRPKYRIEGAKLKLYPTPQDTYTLRLHYASGFTVSSLSTELDLREGWDQWIVLNACIMVRSRQQKDASDFWAQLQTVEDRIRKQMKRDHYGSRVIRDQRGMSSHEVWPHHRARRSW